MYAGFYCTMTTAAMATGQVFYPALSCNHHDHNGIMWQVILTVLLQNISRRLTLTFHVPFQEEVDGVKISHDTFRTFSISINKIKAEKSD